MRPLRPGQDTVLSWSAGALDCRVVAAAGSFVLLRPEHAGAVAPPAGTCSLTYLDGMIPVGWDGEIEHGSVPGELRFRVHASGIPADRRSTVRVPVFADVEVSAGSRAWSSRLLDVSAGGLRFRADDRVAPGTPIHVRFTLPDGPLVEADGVVRASEPGTTAVEFTDLQASTAEEIGSWTVGRLRAALSGHG